MTNAESSSVSVLNGTALQSTISVGQNPVACAFDPENGYIYVTNLNSSNVSVIGGSSGTILATVTAGGSEGPLAIGYDAQNGWMYTAMFFANSTTGRVNGTESVINGTTLVGWLGGGFVGQNVIWDSQDEGLYIPNDGSDNVSVILNGYSLTLVKTGLPPGTDWWVNVNGGPSNTTTDSSLMFTLRSGVYTYQEVASNRSYTTAEGAVNVTWRTLVTIAFQRAYTVTFTFRFTPLANPAKMWWSRTEPSRTSRPPRQRSSGIAQRKG